jgi:membrane-associated phospholipid phosphatase
VIWQLLPVTPAAAQHQPSHNIRWWHVAIAAAAIGTVSAADRSVDTWVQDHRSSHSDALARAFRNGGQPEVVFGVPAALLTAGLITGHKDLERSGVRVFASVVLAGVFTGGAKVVTGRLRPDESTTQYSFKPFTHHDALPSGHATVAFALATSLADEIRRPWASALLFAGATGTAWSRLNDHKHWLSDVVAGAAVGITAANVIEGRWRIFGLGPPAFLISPTVARVEWRLRF